MILPFSVVVPVIFVAVFLCPGLTAQTNQIPETPCPDLFQYIRKGNRNVGIVTIHDVSYGKTTLTVELSQQGYMELDYSGQLSLNFNKDKIHEYIEAGRPFTYRVDFPLQNVVPRVTSIKLNGFQICSGPAYGLPRTNMKLEHTLNAYSGSSGSISPKKFLGNSFNERQPSSQGSTFGTDLPEFLKFSPSFAQQMRRGPSTNGQPSYTQPPYPQSAYTSGSNLPEFLKLDAPYTPQMSSSPSSLGQPLYTQPPHTYQYTPSFLNLIPPSRNNQQNFGFPTHPQNTPPPTFAPHLTPTVPAVKEPMFVTPTTVDTTPTPQSEINNRNPNTRAGVPEIDSTDPATLDYINSICGRENLNFDVKRLNVRGTVISKSRFPWIVAIFKKKDDDRDDFDDDKLDFRCGGSLISTRTVVSAAHCFYKGLEAIKPEDIVISMGRHNLTDWEDANNIDANQIITHPDYRPAQTNFDADLAIVRLKASVTFTDLVKPICMWQGNKDPREIVGMSGAIVGWGSDGRQKTTIVPTLVNATVVAEITCIRSNSQFLKLTSSRTICAGNADGSGPCMGDSGNGLMLRSQNKWMLRGTVSAAPDSPIRRCVLDDYAIYADIAMFIEWIGSNMLL